MHIKTAFNIINNTFDKIANDEDKSSKKITKGVAGAGALALSKDKLLGHKTLYHGTSSKNWDKIKKDGIRADKGGSGASKSVNNPKYISASKGHTYVTSVKPKANIYAWLGENGHPDSLKEYSQFRRDRIRHKNDGSGETFIGLKPNEVNKYKELQINARKDATAYNVKSQTPLNKGKTVKIKMNYDKYKDKYNLDPDEVGALLKGKGENAERLGKFMAAKGKVDIDPSEIVGTGKGIKRLQDTVKNLPSYAKNNKKRFLTGAGLGVAGASLIGEALKKDDK